MSQDIQSLLPELKRLAEAATPGPWEWWTSNSVLRLSGADGKDGGVLYAYATADRHADVVCSEENKAFIAAANPATVSALIAHIEELERQLAELRQASEWQPIETAPKDGTLILAYVEWCDGPDQEIGAFKDGEFYPKNRDYPSLTPTHWMHLSAAPSAGQAMLREGDQFAGKEGVADGN